MGATSEEADRGADPAADRPVEIARACVERSIGRVESMQPLAGGVMNLAYEVTTALGPPLVVRVAQRGGRHFEAERAVLDALVTHGLPEPL